MSYIGFGYQAYCLGLLIIIASLAEVCSSFFLGGLPRRSRRYLVETQAIASGDGV
ncbi:MULTISPECIES: hypothetical protein [Cyanophyceae]|uniref:hypothetical protein n=1 Tax=Cyanophyceae TaxID=3028117 RepID=UPI0016840AA3|nr:hypothetical protein [Trichocoleus sp. FACHB-40]MBD2003677.1 hypothetical protein [Trichocoleus sp. FACHB-40]